MTCHNKLDSLLGDFNARATFTSSRSWSRHGPSGLWPPKNSSVLKKNQSSITCSETFHRVIKENQSIDSELKILSKKLLFQNVKKYVA